MGELSGKGVRVGTRLDSKERDTVVTISCLDCPPRLICTDGLLLSKGDDEGKNTQFLILGQIWVHSDNSTSVGDCNKSSKKAQQLL